MHPTVYQLPSLPGGRQVRTYNDNGKTRFTQVDMFQLTPHIPMGETIMGNLEYDISIKSSIYPSIGGNGFSRARVYAFYPKGFEFTLNLQIGKEITYVEDGVSYVLAVPDVLVTDPISGNKVSLQKAAGMGVFRDIGLLKLEREDENRYKISVVSDLKEGDISVVDIMRPRGWALTDQNGFPLRTLSSNGIIPEARYSYVRSLGELPDSNGWHGSPVRTNNLMVGGGPRHIILSNRWSELSTVGLVQSDVILPSIVVIDPKTLLDRAKKLDTMATGIEHFMCTFPDFKTPDLTRTLIEEPRETAALLRKVASTM